MALVSTENDLVFIGIPQERVLFPEFVDNRDRIYSRLAETGLAVEMFQVRGHRVDRNRDKIVRAFLDHPQRPDWLLMLDSDMKHPDDVALRLIAHRAPIVGALYFYRGSHAPLVFKRSKVVDDEYGRPTMMWSYMRDEIYDRLVQAGLPNRDDCFSLSAPGNPLIECDAVGTGCIMINRRVLEAMEPPWFEYRSGGRSEDIDFCYRAKEELGVPIVADTSTICGHYHLVPLGQAQFRSAHRGRGITATNYTEDEAVEWLQRFAGMSDADAKMARYHPSELGDLWDGFDQHAEIVDFYRQKEVGEAYLLDLLWWNASPLFAELRNSLAGIDGARVIEIGSGIGTVSIQMAMQRCDVTAIEPNDVLRKFSNFRWQWTKNNKAVGSHGEMRFLRRFKRGESRPLKDKFDLGIAIDVFEHMDERVLTRTMGMLASNIKPGGRLFYHNNWSQQDIYPMHMDHSELWSSLIDELPFQEIGDRWLLRVADEQ